ncbi:MAG: ThuA protein [Mucilaginibacter sp.]|nr:ThuA protein [Mucilaginibacter sp.]
MKNYRLAGCYALGAIAILLFFSMAGAKPNPKVLVFCKTTGYHHQSIAVGIVAIQKLGAENNFDVDTTTDVTKFTTDNLKQYATLIFLSPTGKGVFNDSTQKDAFKKYIAKGGGFVGIHAATDFEYDWAWYGNLVGAYFFGHPKNNIQEAVLNVVDDKNIATKHLPKQWKRKDEYYSYRPGMSKDLHVLITLDESTMNYGTQTNLKMGDFHPLAWYHNFEGGRAFYTELGHTDETYADPLFLQHLLGGIKYAMGKKYTGK